MTTIAMNGALKGAVERASGLPFLDPPVSGQHTMEAARSWSNNWADWTDSSQHNNWENMNPNPPGGK